MSNSRTPPPPAVVGYQESPSPARALAEQDPNAPANQNAAASAGASKPPATETLAARTGALVNEIDFPGFVAQLVNGTFDAIVDASIRQMESYASLVAAVAKTVDQFTEENVTPNQARDWLAQRHSGDVFLALPQSEGEQPQLMPRREGEYPGWLADYELEGEELTSELLEQQLLPKVRNKVGAERQQLLAAMVMLGINRVAVRDGSVTAKVMFRAAAQDVAKVHYAVGSDPAAMAEQNWGQRGSTTYSTSNTMVSTVAVNAQNESSVRADLFGEVKLNFVSETLPLERMADAAKMALIQRHAPGIRPASAAPATAPAPATPKPDQGGQ